MPLSKNIPPDQASLPIGVFDSGIGGLTVLHALQARFPQESYLYVGDTARLPYGTKSPETVMKYAEGITAKIIAHGVKAIVIACNTASTHALPAVQAMAGHIPVIGMIEPAAAAALAHTQTGHIGVMATFGTVRSAAYAHAIHQRSPEAVVSSVACQMLVALAEEGWVEGDIPRAVLHRYLDPMFDRSDAPDTLILGCTHFPVFADVLHDMLGSSVTLINSGEAAARYLAPYLGTAPNPEPRPSHSFWVTDDPARFAESAIKFFDHRLSESAISLIDITPS